MSNKNLTKTLFADFRKVDTKKLNINGNPFSKVKDTREVITENDLWANSVTTDENGVVIVTQGATIDGTDWSDINGYDRKQDNDGTKTITKVENNKAYDGDTFLFNIETNAIENGTKMFYVSELASWDGDLSSLIDGTSMFSYCNDLASFNGDLSNLNNGSYMFCDSAFQSFSGDLSSLDNGSGMFYGSALESFNGDLSNLTNGQCMFYNTPLTSFNSDLSKLTDGRSMFWYTTLESFNGDLSNLTDGTQMFGCNPLESFNGDLSSLTNGYGMFSNTPLQSFNGDLSSLVNGQSMFYHINLASFNDDLPSLTNGDRMFAYNSLESFNGDLSSLVDGNCMFSHNQPRRYGVGHYKMVDGTKTWVTETFVSNGLKSFISNLSSLKSGYQMFGDGSDVTCEYTDDSGATVTETTKNIAPLDEESIMLIADTINDISNNSDWSYATYDYYGNPTTETIYLDYRGILHLGYDSSITDTTNIFKYCDEIVAKGWTVYLNGSRYTSTDSGSAALIDGESSTTPIPYYYKPIQVTDEKVAKYVDGNGNFYIIVGGQHVFGDDISTYGMFTSYEHAVNEISISLSLTPYVKPTEVIIEE